MQGVLRVARLGVVGVWIALLVVLGRSQLPSGSIAAIDASNVAPAAAASTDEWMGLYMSGRKIGYSHSKRVPEASGSRFEETSYMRMSVLEEVQTVTVLIAGSAGPDDSLRSFTLALNSGVGKLEVDGKVEGDSLQLRMRTPADTTEQAIRLEKPIYLPSSARARLRGVGLAEGRSIVLDVFDPSSLSHHPLELAVAGREQVEVEGTTHTAWKVRETFRGITSDVWLDEAGRTLRETGPMGLMAQREDPERALSAGWGSEAFDLMAAVAVPLRGSIQNPRDLAALNARLGGPAAATVPNDHRQHMRDGLLSVERERNLRSGYRLPATDDTVQADLQPTAFLQSDHPRIRAVAAAARGDTTDPLVAAQRLRHWVYEKLDKRPMVTVPNALQVLDLGAGDCNEHAVLFAAMARAIGLPARVVAGIVYSEGAFLYHAWDEVWLGSGWVSVDPAFDQMPADATHVKLITGGPEVHADLVPVMGQLSLDLVTAQAANAER